MVWIYADKLATPTNYAKIDIANEELILFGRGGSNNYRQLMGDKADECGSFRRPAAGRDTPFGLGGPRNVFVNFESVTC